MSVYVSIHKSFGSAENSHFTGYPGSPVLALDFLARHRSPRSASQRAVLFEAARSSVQRLCRVAAGPRIAVDIGVPP